MPKYPVDLSKLRIQVSRILHNPSVAILYEEALRNEPGTAISSTGALIALSGAKTGRSPTDKRVVESQESKQDIWWGDVNIKLQENVFLINRERAIDYFNTLDKLYIVDGFAGWDTRYRLKVRVICERAYHALFMKNMLVNPTEEELEHFGEPDFTILNAGRFPANAYTTGMTSKTSVDLSFKHREFVILGTEYAGEMKKGVFTIMNYMMPKQGILSMHCSANVGSSGDLTLFFGLSGTGKTTLSADPKRQLIGDDEHCWTDDGIFNIEGGCYAKAINLSPREEPQIYNAIRYGTVVENVVYRQLSRQIDFSDTSLTQNTRCSYPISYIPNALIPCIGPQPKNIIFLTCDAFSILPPVSKLTAAQAMYHFISGYTAKVAGTEMGVNEPQATFSACFGAPFLVWHPTKYALLLAEKMRQHNTNVWLVNTGWIGGAYGVGKRMSLSHTRGIIDAINEGTLEDVQMVADPIFGFEVPLECPDVPSEVLLQRDTWSNEYLYWAEARKLSRLFHENFEKYADEAGEQILQAAPRLG